MGKLKTIEVLKEYIKNIIIEYIKNIEYINLKAEVSQGCILTVGMRFCLIFYIFSCRRSGFTENHRAWVQPPCSGVGAT